jgi:hypothetical protein
MLVQMRYCRCWGPGALWKQVRGLTHSVITVTVTIAVLLQV